MTKQAIVSEPSQSAENGTDTEEKPSIWASILRDVKSSTKKAPATKSLVVLGDNESGRTTLVAKLQGNDDPKRGAGLEYHYIDVKDDDRDDTPKLGVWILDGDVACSAPLLKFAIKPDTLEHTILILVASMTHPWSLLATLKKWTALVEEHIDRLHIDPTRLRQMRDRLQYEFQHYTEPNDTSIMLTSSASSTTIKSGTGGSRIPNSLSSISLASTSTLSPTTNGEEQIVLPLADGVLTKSLGISIIVVITKCDVMPTLEKENDYKDEYFDFMQHHLRKFCLEYGAALFYTSVKEKKNIDRLYKYIVHKCYGYPFTSTAAIVERDAIFIPAGWDNPKKADILLENLHRLKPTDNYADVFVKPVVRRPLQRDSEIVTAEDDQEFLSKLQLTLNRAASPGRADENATPVLSRSSGTGGTGGSQTPSVASRPRNQPSTTPGGTSAAANEGALANFFNSLLTRKSGGAVTPTGSGTPVAQRQTSQSPTTPSSKRLQQHPLTFAVTPPPGRTRTPTSHKPFASPINTKSPPRLLSPVVEQRSKAEPSAASPTSARTPLDEPKASETVANTNSDPWDTTNVESTQRDSTEKDSDEALRAANEPVISTDEQKTETIVSNDDLALDITDNSRTQLSPAIEQESTVPEDDNNPPLSNTSSVPQVLSETSDNSAPANQSRPGSPMRPDETAEEIREVDRTSANPSRSSSPTTNNNEKTFDRSPSVDRKSPELAASSNNELKPQMNEIEYRDEQQTNVTPSSSSSRRGSETKSPVRSRSTSIVSNNASLQQDDQLLSVEPSERRSQSPVVLDDSDTPHSMQKNSPPSSPHTEETTDVGNPNEETKENSPPNIVSSSDENATVTEHRSPSPTDERQIKALMADDTQQTSPVAEQSSSSFAAFDNTTVDEALTPHTDDIKFDSGETSTTVLPVEDNQQRSRSPSPITQEISRTASLNSEQIGEKNQSSSLSDAQRSRPSSPVVKQDQQRSRSPSPSVSQKEEKSRSSSPIAEQNEERASSPQSRNHQEPQRSRSPSPVATQNQERTRSPSPVAQANEQRSRSPSPIGVPHQERAPSPSLILRSEHRRSRSPSPTTQPNEQRSRSPSPSMAHNQPRSRSRSPTGEPNEERTQSPSPLTHPEQRRSRSPSPVAVKNQERTRSPSPIIQADQQRSRSPSPSVVRNQPRSRSPSPTGEPNQERTQSPSLATHSEQRRSRSPSPVAAKNQERTRSPSPITQVDQQRSCSPSPSVVRNQPRSRSPSPTGEPNQERTKSPSLVTHSEQGRSRSRSPVSEQDQGAAPSPSSIIQAGQGRSRSPSPNVAHSQARSRSPSPIIQADQQRSRSPSPSVVRNQARSRSPSLTGESNQERTQSPLLLTHQEQQRSRSPSPAGTPKQERASSPPLSRQADQHRSRAPSPSVAQNQPRSRSRSPMTKLDDERAQSPSLLTQQEQQRSRSPSPSVSRDHQRSRSPSPSLENEMQRESRLPSSNTENEPVLSRSASPTNEQNQELEENPLNTTQQEHQRSRSPSPSTTLPLESVAPLLSSTEQDAILTPSTVEEQAAQRSRSPSRTDQRRRQSNQSESSIDNNALSSPSRGNSRSPVSLSPKLDENRSSRSPNSFQYETTPDVTESIMSAPEQRMRSRSPSPVVADAQNPIDNNETARASPTLSNRESENLQKSPLLSPTSEQPLRSPSPSVENKGDDRMTPLGPSSPGPLAANSTSQAAASPVTESAPSESPRQVSEHALADRSSESNAASNFVPPIHRKASITRSHSQSMLARPKTLLFSPNEHNLDGLYMSNDYNDEDEMSDDIDHHHSSAPSTVSVEFRRSSLLHGQNMDHRQTPVDPNDILQRLSLIEKSRAEDSENPSVDSTNAKDS